MTTFTITAVRTDGTPHTTTISGYAAETLMLKLRAEFMGNPKYAVVYVAQDGDSYSVHTHPEPK